ncbi:MAG: hypothetical protein ACOC3S_00190 [Bacteroidota bacterium]
MKNKVSKILLVLFVAGLCSCSTSNRASLSCGVYVDKNEMQVKMEKQREKNLRKNSYN